MKIGELAALTDLRPSRIRYYEKMGLLRSVNRQANGYRTYPPEAVTVLKLITSAKQAGFSLDELRALLPSDKATWDHDSLVVALQQKIHDIDEIQERLAQNKARLQDVLAQVVSKPHDMDCATNARRVLSQLGLGDPDMSVAKAPDEPPFSEHLYRE